MNRREFIQSLAVFVSTATMTPKVLAESKKDPTLTGLRNHLEAQLDELPLPEINWADWNTLHFEIHARKVTQVYVNYLNRTTNGEIRAKVGKLMENYSGWVPDEIPDNGFISMDVMVKDWGKDTYYDELTIEDINHRITGFVSTDPKFIEKNRHRM